MKLNLETHSFSIVKISTTRLKSNTKSTCFKWRLCIRDKETTSFIYIHHTKRWKPLGHNKDKITDVVFMNNFNLYAILLTEKVYIIIKYW